MKNCESGLIKYSRKKELPDSHACHTIISHNTLQREQDSYQISHSWYHNRTYCYELIGKWMISVSNNNLQQRSNLLLLILALTCVLASPTQATYNATYVVEVERVIHDHCASLTS